MDEIVKAALKKWPNVPHVHGWLGLDARGDWYLRDEAAQHAGDFPAVKGSPIRHDKLREFIHRNYEHDDAGCWFFQNGPQRVYVELEAAPWVWRVDPSHGIVSHTGRPATYRAAWLDDVGRLYVEADLGFGLVHTLDMDHAAAAIDAGAWRVSGELRFAEVPARFGYVLSPQRRLQESS